MTEGKHYIASMRRNYSNDGLLEKDLKKNPVEQFSLWFEAAKAKGILEPNAMTLSTVTKEKKPAARIVLLKDFTDKGFSFYTNYESRKGKEILENPFGTLLFFWDALERQIRIDGKIEKLSREESEKYFHARPFESQVGAHTSHQSEVIGAREELEARYEVLLKQYKDKTVPMPDYWGGYLLVPETIEFWQGRASRLHDRILYEKTGSSWKIFRLSP